MLWAASASPSAGFDVWRFGVWAARATAVATAAWWVARRSLSAAMCAWVSARADARSARRAWREATSPAARVATNRIATPVMRLAADGWRGSVGAAVPRLVVV